MKKPLLFGFLKYNFEIITIMRNMLFVLTDKKRKLFARSIVALFFLWARGSARAAYCSAFSNNLHWIQNR